LFPVAIPPNGLLPILVKLATSLLMLSQEQPFDRGLGDWGTQHVENFFFPNSPRRMSLMVWTVVRK
jgi:hypothetical protein